MEIEFDFSATKIIYTNHLAMIIYIVQKILDRKNLLTAIVGNERIDGKTLVDTLYRHYAAVKNPFIYPRIISYRNGSNSNSWLTELKSLNLEYYEKIKIIISELFANLKMHTTFQEGAFAGFIDNYNKYLFLSIINYDIEIKKTIELKQHMIFKSDFEALIWALKKTNTTRNEDESGGLGLYLLRKYIHELHGECTIVTGNCFLRLDETCFNSINVNQIFFVEYKKLMQNYGGNIISLKLPLEKSLNIAKNRISEEININLEGLNGLFS